MSIVESGWPGFFRILRIYLTHFRGQRSAMMQWMAPVAGTEAEAWETLTAALGLKGVSAGQRWTAPAGVPAISGVVEHVSKSPCNALMRLDKPGPGTAALGAVNCGGPIMVTLSFYLYGDQAAGTVARETPLWQAWIQERFPMRRGTIAGWLATSRMFHYIFWGRIHMQTRRRIERSTGASRKAGLPDRSRAERWATAMTASPTAEQRDLRKRP